ncbi:MAG: hypothetical protein KF862_15630 [Chitinophagaceae bacterium]|nr:hypothetical protein [Chitinophagaceae bacterium]
MKLTTQVIVLFLLSLQISCNPAKEIVLSSFKETASLKISAGRHDAQLFEIGWDTEGTGRDTINLLSAPAKLQLQKKGQLLNPKAKTKIISSHAIQYEFLLPGNKRLAWQIETKDSELIIQLISDDDIDEEVDKIELLLPFNPRKAMTSVISSNWNIENKFRLPVVISAPDIGQMLTTGIGNKEITGYSKGNRSEGTLHITIEIPVPGKGFNSGLKFNPLILHAPQGYTDENKWKSARRGWFNFIQQSCGASGGGEKVVGVWANNALSDPVSSTIYMLADAVLLVPELAPGVPVAPILRRSLDYFINHKTTSYGLVGYTAGGTPALVDDKGDPDPNDRNYNAGQHQMVMDGNPSLIIGAWAYYKVSADKEWLLSNVKTLELIAGYMAGRDVDHDGMIESKQSGNSRSRPPRNPDMAYDAYASGHKNAYINALAYRSFKCLAYLEKELENNEREEKYLQLAVRIKAAYINTFYNPETGWLAWWKSEDGNLHDIYSDIPTSLAISYGIVDKQAGKEMLQRYWEALEKTSFKRFDLGLPVCLRPVKKEDMEHYTEFEMFLNGGCAVSNTSCTLDALYCVGMTEQADMVLNAMLERQRRGVFPNGGGFQNGFVDKYPNGGEIYDWSGNTAGYEGHLVYCWTFLQSLLYKDLALRKLRDVY